MTGIEMRRIVVLLVCLNVCQLGMAEEVQLLPRIGWMWTGPPSPPSPFLQAFLGGMRDLGYIEGEDFLLDAKYTRGRNELLGQQARALIAHQADVIVAGPAAALLAVQQETSSTPIIMTLGADPASFGVTGPNITGLTEIAPQLVSERVKLLGELVPAIKNVAILWQPTTLREEQVRRVLQDSEDTLRRRGGTVGLVEASTADDFDSAFVAIRTSQADALVILVSPMFFSERSQIIERVAASGLPAIYGWKEYVRAGGLISYGPDLADIYRRAAGYADEIIQGARPRDLPIGEPVTFDLAINLRTAKALNLAIPQVVLQRADHVIE